ncbi:hypothetical protein FIBSPDRAFT_903983 [Athelia psychrophila]|uniref:Uncharacterized protein n=1 Tax=Athelia psychrophila TaxID=1759441 RepID=A0A167VBC4_9AGAM|nr:hypothetical protein FIBSPDRAFT_903983 [Fibularhizoctonia sp. CBS 109695]
MDYPALEDAPIAFGVRSSSLNIARTRGMFLLPLVSWWRVTIVAILLVWRNIWHIFNKPLEVDSESILSESPTTTPASTAPPLEPPQQRSVADMAQPVLVDAVDPNPKLSYVTTAGDSAVWPAEIGRHHGFRLLCAPQFESMLDRTSLATRAIPPELILT